MDSRQIWRSPPRTFRWRFEVPGGPVTESLKGRGFVVYAINAKQLDRFSPAASKDDSLDVRVLADALKVFAHPLDGFIKVADGRPVYEFRVAT